MGDAHRVRGEHLRTSGRSRTGWHVRPQPPREGGCVRSGCSAPSSADLHERPLEAPGWPGPVQPGPERSGRRRGGPDRVSARARPLLPRAERLEHGQGGGHPPGASLERRCGRTRVMVLPRGSGTSFSFFFFNDTATTEIYTLSLHDALPISPYRPAGRGCRGGRLLASDKARSEEHTSELQSRENLVCRLLLEKKKNEI